MPEYNGRHEHDDEVSLRDYFDGRWDAHSHVHNAEQMALDKAYTVLEQRLAGLNELRREVTTDRQAFLRTDVYESRHQSLKAAIDRNVLSIGEISDQLIAHVQLPIHPAAVRTIDDFEARIRSLEAWRSRAAGVAVVLVLLAGTIGAAIAKAFGA